MRDSITAWATPILLTIVGYFGVSTLHSVENTLAMLQSQGMLVAERLTKIETKIGEADQQTLNERSSRDKLESKLDDLDRRATKLEVMLIQRQASDSLPRRP